MGYDPHNHVTLGALNDAGKRLTPVCFDQPSTTTHLLIDCSTGQESKFLILHDNENDRLELPYEEEREALCHAKKETLKTHYIEIKVETRPKTRIINSNT